MGSQGRAFYRAATRPPTAMIGRDDYLSVFGAYPFHTHSMACGRNCAWALPTPWPDPRQNRYWYSYPLAFSTLAMRLLASTQSCIPSRMTFGLSRSASPTDRNSRIGFFGLSGMSVLWKPHAPSGNFGSNGHCWFTNVPDVVRTRR